MLEEIIEGEALKTGLAGLIAEISEVLEVEDGWRILRFTCNNKVRHEILPAGVSDKPGEMAGLERSNLDITLNDEEEALVTRVIEENLTALTITRIGG